MELFSARRRLATLARVGGAVAAALTVTLAAALPATAATSTLSTVSDGTVQTNGRVSAVLTVGTTTYLGGSFTSVRPAGAPLGTGEVPRNHLAAVDTATGQLITGWDPGADDEVYALAASTDGQTIYVGGHFGTLAGAARKRLGAVSATTGQVTPFVANTTVKVLALYASPTTLYVGGGFTTMGGQPRSFAAAVDPVTGAVRPGWAPAANAEVRVIAPSADGTALYLGGEFTTVNGLTSEKYLTKVTPDTAALLPWKNHPGYPVWSVVATPTAVYLGGNGAGGHAGSFTTAGVRGWITQTDGGVQSIGLLNGVLYVGGHFDNVCLGDSTGASSGFLCPTSQAVRHKVVAVDAATGATDPYDPSPNSALGVYSLTVSGGRLQIGGDFTAVGHLPGSTTRLARQGFAQFSPAV